MFKARNQSIGLGAKQGASADRIAAALRQECGWAWSSGGRKQTLPHHHPTKEVL